LIKALWTSVRRNKDYWWALATIAALAVNFVVVDYLNL